MKLKHTLEIKQFSHSSLLHLCKVMILYSQNKYDKAIEECKNL